MKVVLLTSGYPRWKGDFTNVYLHRLARSLRDEGVEVHVVCPHAPGLKELEHMDEVFIHRFRYAFPSRFEIMAYLPGVPERLKTIKGKVLLPFFVVGMWLSILRITKEKKIDIIHAHWAIPSGFVSAIARLLLSKPIVVTLYGAELWPALRKNRGLIRKLIRYTLRSAERVVAISDATAEAGRSIAGTEIEVLPDGIDVETFNETVDGQAARKKIPGDNRFVLFASGRMVERKGFVYLVQALPRVLKSFPSTKLVIGGDGPEKNRIMRTIEELGLTDRVLLPGFIPEEDFPAYMKGSDIFVLPSIIDNSGDTEGSATILLEAMACGTPVVGTRVGGVPYAVKDGVGGYLVEQKDPDQLSEAILKILNDDNLRREMGRLGRAYVVANFSWRSTAKRYSRIFQETAEGGHQ